MHRGKRVWRSATACVVAYTQSGVVRSGSPQVRIHVPIIAEFVMFRFLRGAAAPSTARQLAFGLLATLAATSNAAAHCFVGQRFLPATIATDDPCVADEMSLLTVTYSKTADVPPATEVETYPSASPRILAFPLEKPGPTSVSRTVRAAAALAISRLHCSTSCSRMDRTSSRCCSD